MPDSTIVVERRMSYSPRSKSRIFFAKVRESIWPCATTIRGVLRIVVGVDGRCLDSAPKSADRRFSTRPMSETRLWRKKTWPPRRSSDSIAVRIVSSESRTIRVSTATRSRGGERSSERSRAPVIER